MVVLSHYIALSPAPWTTAALRLETLQGREVRLAWSADTRSHLTPYTLLLLLLLHVLLLLHLLLLLLLTKV